MCRKSVFNVNSDLDSLRSQIRIQITILKYDSSWTINDAVYLLWNTVLLRWVDNSKFSYNAADTKPVFKN